MDFKKRQRRLTSEVWVNFDFLDEPDANGNPLWKCKKCGTTYNADSKNGTGNLKRHVLNCKRRNYLDEGQMIIDSSTSGSLKSRVSRLPDINADVFRELVASAIVRHNLPFQFAEYEGVRKCFSYLHPEVKVVSRNTVKADILKMYKREKSNLRDYMTGVPSRISLSADCWSSITTDGYISLTAHFIDNHWTLQKRILNFRFVAPPHSGGNMSDEVCSMLKEWGIQKKIMSITLDSASSNDVFADVLKSELDLVCGGDYFHVSCFAHILNLMVQDGLKEIDDVVIKVRESVKYCKGSQDRRQRFLACVAHVELDNTRGLRQDVPTRWNSTYMMLESVLYYKKAFIYFQKSDANYIHCPTTDEWVRIEKIFRFLKVFYDVTKIFSGTLYPTSNIFFPNMLKVRLLLKEEMGSNDQFMKSMANKMYEKFSKYWANFSTIMAVAVVLDPRFKIQFVEWAYKKVYGEFEYFSELSKVKDKLNALYDAYFHRYAAVLSTSHSHKRDNTSGQQDVVDANAVCDEFMMDFDNFSLEKSMVDLKSNLAMYLEEPLVRRTTNLDILYHWRTNSGRFPVLSSMARDVLAIPISTVTSELAFSTGGRVLDYNTSSLKPANVEAILCLKDWTFGEAKMDPQLEDLCGKVMTLKADDADTPSPPESTHPSPSPSPSPAESAMENSDI